MPPHSLSERTPLPPLAHMYRVEAIHHTNHPRHLSPARTYRNVSPNNIEIDTRVETTTDSRQPTRQSAHTWYKHLFREVLHTQTNTTHHTPHKKHQAHTRGTPPKRPRSLPQQRAIEHRALRCFTARNACLESGDPPLSQTDKCTDETMSYIPAARG